MTSFEEIKMEEDETFDEFYRSEERRVGKECW